MGGRMGADLNDFFADPERLRLRADPERTWEKNGRSKVGVFANRVQAEFIKGPIPLAWLSAAAELPGKAALAVGLALWFERGRRKSDEVTLTTTICRRFGVVDRKGKYRGLAALEEAGLVAVEWRPNRNPVVTILEAAG